MVWKPKDIEQMRREDQSRGKRPAVPEEVYRERIKKLQDLRRLLEIGDLNLFKKALNAYGLKEGMKEYDGALEIWKQFHRAR